MPFESLPPAADYCHFTPFRLDSCRYYISFIAAITHFFSRWVWYAYWCHIYCIIFIIITFHYAGVAITLIFAIHYYLLRWDCFLRHIDIYCFIAIDRHMKWLSILPFNIFIFCHCHWLFSPAFADYHWHYLRHSLLQTLRLSFVYAIFIAASLHYAAWLISRILSSWLRLLPPLALMLSFAFSLIELLFASIIFSHYWDTPLPPLRHCRPLLHITLIFAPHYCCITPSFHMLMPHYIRSPLLIIDYAAYHFTPIFHHTDVTTLDIMLSSARILPCGAHYAWCARALSSRSSHLFTLATLIIAEYADTHLLADAFYWWSYYAGWLMILRYYSPRLRHDYAMSCH